MSLNSSSSSSAKWCPRSSKSFENICDSYPLSPSSLSAIGSRKCSTPQPQRTDDLQLGLITPQYTAGVQYPLSFAAAYTEDIGKFEGNQVGSIVDEKVGNSVYDQFIEVVVDDTISNTDGDVLSDPVGDTVKGRL
jgi:hypothetical protein